MTLRIMQHTRGKSSGARCPVHHIPIIPVFTPAGRCAQLPSVTSGRSPDQSQAAQWMGAWRDDSFLFRQVSPQLGEHVNKFKINSEPLPVVTIRIHLSCRFLSHWRPSPHISPPHIVPPTQRLLTADFPRIWVTYLIYVFLIGDFIFFTKWNLDINEPICEKQIIFSLYLNFPSIEV